MPITETGPQPQPRLHLAEARLSRDWSQQEVAERIGTNYVNVSRWERGVTKPTPYFRRKLCHLFGKTEQELDLEGSFAEPTEDISYKTGKQVQTLSRHPLYPHHLAPYLLQQSGPIYRPYYSIKTSHTTCWA